MSESYDYELVPMPRDITIELFDEPRSMEDADPLVEGRRYYWRWFASNFRDDNPYELSFIWPSGWTAEHVHRAANDQLDAFAKRWPELTFNVKDQQSRSWTIGVFCPRDFTVTHDYGDEFYRALRYAKTHP